jgi:hypothetical protein
MTIPSVQLELERRLFQRLSDWLQNCSRHKNYLKPFCIAVLLQVLL